MIYLYFLETIYEQKKESYIQGYNAANTVCSTGWTDKQIEDFAFEFYQDCSSLMNVPFNLISENKLHIQNYLQQYKLSHSLVQVDSRIQQK